MPRFEPFRAVRYAAGVDLDAVLAPPYDVLSDAEVELLAARDEHHIVHVDVPRGADDRYEVAGRLLRRWIADGVMVSDVDPSFTLYRMRFTDDTGADRDLVGVVGALEVVDEGAGGVLPHEQTTPKASTDRLDLTRSTEANLSPVWALSLAEGLTALLAEPGEVVGSVTVDPLEQPVEHSVERITEPARLAAIAAHVARDDVLIADGHHRYAISRTYRDEVGTDAAQLTMAFVGELVAEQLSIEAIHRLYTGIGFEELRDALAASFTFERAERPSPSTLKEMRERGRLVLIGPEGIADWLVPRPDAFVGVRALDGAWLEHALAGTPAASEHVTYQHGLEEVVAAVTTGMATAAVLIRPVSIGEIERTAREGLLMPPKSTFFTPKLRTGFVVRDLRDRP